MMARRRRKGLSERQQRILEFIDSFQKNNGYPPSIREIRDHTRITSTSVVNYYLVQLQEMGYIERDNHVSRGIRLIQPISRAINEIGQAVSELLQIPIIGRIVAGSPVPMPSSDFSYFDAESMVDVASSLLPSSERNSKLYALEVQGDSMIDAMVYNGDIVIMKPAQEAHNGEMVAVWLRDREETTLKYFYRENEQVRLQPANPNMQPIYQDAANVEIQGKVVMVIRQVKGLVS
jgi:repressor LexA